MRKGWGRWEWLYMTLCLVAFVVAFPVMFPVAMIQHALAERRKKRTVQRAPCARCGAVLGQAALDRADAEWSAHLEKLFRENPGVRFRLVRTVHAICMACGQSHRYDEAADAFVAALDEPFTYWDKQARVEGSDAGGG